MARSKRSRRLKWRAKLCAWLILLCLLPSGSHASAVHKQIRHDKQVLELQLSEAFTPAMQDVLVEWLDYISQSLLGVYGRWPRERWKIIVTPVPTTAADPIPWGQVQRGEINRVEFYTAKSASVDQLKHAWTGYHELSHLLIPYRGWGDIWFSEGLASYYQNLLQARTGILNERQMWQKLYAGFTRGRAQTEFDGINLQAVSDAMRENRAYMRVYWSGAWYFLAADVKLRRLWGGKRGLDQALEKLNLCCADKKMSVVDMARKLDELNGISLFYPLYLEAINSTRVPAFEPILTRLGVWIDDNREVQLKSSGPGAELRSQITMGTTL